MKFEKLNLEKFGKVKLSTPDSSKVFGGALCYEGPTAVITPGNSEYGGDDIDGRTEHDRYSDPA